MISNRPHKKEVKDQEIALSLPQRFLIAAEAYRNSKVSFKICLVFISLHAQLSTFVDSSYNNDYIYPVLYHINCIISSIYIQSLNVSVYKRIFQKLCLKKDRKNTMIVAHNKFKDIRPKLCQVDSLQFTLGIASTPYSSSHLRYPKYDSFAFIRSKSLLRRNLKSETNTIIKCIDALTNQSRVHM